MKTTLDIPDRLLEDVMKISGARTKRAVVLQALEEFRRRARMEALLSRLGRSETFMDADQLVSLRSQEMPSDK
ncbi:MAG: type II toxin-antitoxin system VapB family antitoxin [Terrimicrobiaceae bacterium]